ncbi:carboxypeptidase-like regulatory domain-containing protein [Haloarcula sp. 1CSR25-25]|uniref:carboxypeptidase-like regulatory domain-containing protein n=1 Tax=Haloarcula sp. 1CSR25-25 TaxID=2862545 RepID=UPI002894E47D|nr:carboxypeptidase-like regulatory domain-containing protein [Haloarcula sp. 1CSR25-25]MDT3437787.1 carboxypeptidase-like regulatory domain-containing protein [Haloarcula sp. 1CSR25-25]
MANTSLEEISTTSRSEMVCPHCWTKGLKKSESYASQFSGSDKKEVIYASSCSNSSCRNYDSGREDPGRVPPEQVKKQYSSVPLAGQIGELLGGNLKIAGLVIIVAIAGVVLLTTGLPFGGAGNGGGTAQAEDISYENITESDSGFSAVKTEGEWTIYESADGERYLVAGEIHGNVTYLEKDGSTTLQPHTFDSVGAAEDAIFAWKTKHDQDPDAYPEPTQTSENLINQTNWKIFEHKDKYIVAAVIDGEVVYLDGDSTISDTPFLFDTRDDARSALLEYYNQYGNESPDGDSITTVERGELREALTEYDSDGDLTDNDSDDGGLLSSDDDGGLVSGDSQDSENTSQITGQIVDSNGEPVEGATVHLYSTPRTTTTNSEGRYHFEEVPAGEHHLFVDPPEGTDMVATQNATLQMGETGELRIKNSSSQYSAFESDGAVTNNEITIQPPKGRPINIAGQGSRVAAPVTFKNSKNADDVEVTLKGVYTEGTTRKQYQGDSYSVSPGIDGNTKPKRQRLTIQGIAATEEITETGQADPSGTQIPIKGNSDPGRVTVDLKENYTETIKTRSSQLSGSSVPLNNTGNLSPDNINLTLKTSQKTYDRQTDKVDLQTSDPNETAVYQASDTETVQIRSNYSYNYDNYDSYWSGDDREHHHYEFEDEVRVFIDRADGPNETIYRYHAERDPESYDSPYKDYKGWYYGIDDGGWSNSTVDLQPGDRVMIEADRWTSDDWIIADNVELESHVYKLKSPESVSVKGAGDGFSTEKVGSGDSVTITSSDIKTEPGMDEIEVSADNLNIEYQLNYTERSGTTGAAVGVNGKQYCRDPDGLTQTVSCDIPTQDLKNDALEIGSAEGSVPYTVTYTKRDIPEQATVEINGKEYKYPQDFSADGPLGGNGQSIAIDSLQPGENSIDVATGSVNGAQPALKTVIRHSSEPRQTNNPTIYVVSASGEVNSKQLPDSALVNGQLVENETVTLPENWFSEGRNVVVVETTDSSQVKVEVEGQGLQTQTLEFRPAAEVSSPTEIPDKSDGN